MSFCRFYHKLLISLFVFVVITTGSVFAANRQEAEKLTIKGLKALKENQVAEAKKFLTQAVQEDPTYDKAHIALGDCFSLEGSYDKAVKEYNKAINLGGDSVILTYKIGKSRYDAKEYDKAVIHFEKLKKAYQDNPEFFYLLGESYRKSNNHQRALVSLERVLTQDKENRKAHLSLGRLYYDLGNWYKAKEHFIIVRDHKDTDESLKEEMVKLITEIETKKQKSKTWHIAIPVVVMMIIVPSYLFLKKHKKEHPETLEEEFDG